MPNAKPASLPDPPYYAVVFTAIRTEGDNGYAARASEMLQLASAQPGFLGVDAAEGADGLGVTVSYWRDEESIASWRNHALHTPTRDEGRERWYETFAVHVAKVERAYGFTRPQI